MERGREQPTGPQLNPEHVEYRTLRRQQQIVIWASVWIGRGERI